MILKKIKVLCTICNSDNYDVIARGPDFEYHYSKEDFRMVRCLDCGMIYLNPRPAPEELDKLYPPEYIPYNFNEHLGTIMGKLRDFVQRKKIDALREYVPNGGLVVDIGCGGGDLLGLAKRFGDPSWELVGIDMSEKAIESVRKRRIRGILGRFETLDLPESSADVIIMNQVIEHLDNPRAVLEKSVKYLKVGGYIFIETPSTDAWDCKLFFKRYWGGWHFPRHWHLFSPQTLRILLEQTGFRIVKNKFLLSPNFWAQSVHHLLVDRGIPQKMAIFFDCKNPLIMSLFSFIDVIQVMSGSSSNMRVVARR